MTFFDWTICDSITVGDLFKLIVPAGWTAVCFAAFLAYLLSPLSRGDPPRVGSACVVLVAALSGSGLSTAVFSFHRATSTFSIDWDEGQKESRRQRLKIHSSISTNFSLLSLALVIFFAGFAPQRELCAHETCGADVGWSAISLISSVIWLLISLMGMRKLSKTGSKIGEVGLPP
uniref:Uncharacterized protein n=1 Tax=Corethron hystrix TaxID=216773 RepID=A0A7S1FQ50_9STRA|mmetsp:Transcript_18767/g.42829  ORF Transcript_18767/g.42829 Transcript_18767/m.42829 type:complete len:175 (+) Transcript_18767:94-618(+)